MRKILVLAVFISASFRSVYAQTELSAYGKIDISDLELKECSFEKDANAMVLFDKGDVYFDVEFDIVMERHQRIKIFNKDGKDEANIRIEYNSVNNLEQVFELQAQTINLKDGKPVITKLEKKQQFKEVIDKYSSAMVFTFPDVQPGSVIEFKYSWKTPSFSNFPSWNFQGRLPVRYTELTTAIPDMLNYKTQYRIYKPLYKNKTSAQSRSLGSGSESVGYTVDIKTIALQDVPSLQDEPYMTSMHDNLQSAIFQLSSIRPLGGFLQTGMDTWAKVAGGLAEDEDFGLQFRKKLEGEDILIAKAKAMSNDEQRICFLFDEVRNLMKWNGVDRWYTHDGIAKAWDKKTGNSTEINLILYRLLKQSGVKSVYPMIVSTRSHGKVNIAFPWLYQFNRAVVTIPVDSTRRYVLDASNKYQLYNAIPENLLNSYGLRLDKENKRHDMVDIQEPKTARKSIYINAEIKPEGKLVGMAQLTDFSYYKINALREYKEGEEKYKEYLSGRDNGLKIRDLVMEDADRDSLPLQEKMNFEMELAGSDGDYIYFSPNIFPDYRKSPFLNETRATMIDFGYNNKYIITGMFKVPAGYKTDVLPKPLNMVMPDKSMSFQRILSQDGDLISIRYIVDLKKPIFFADEYPELRQFYKQLIEMLNEQIVLKKS